MLSDSLSVVAKPSTDSFIMFSSVRNWPNVVACLDLTRVCLREKVRVPDMAPGCMRSPVLRNLIQRRLHNHPLVIPHK